MNGKKRLVIYATCQGQYLSRVLGCSQALANDFRIEFYPNYSGPGCFSAPPFSPERLDDCQVFLYHAVKNEEGRRVVASLLAALPPGALCLTLPYVTSNIYWMAHLTRGKPLGVTPRHRFGLIPYPCPVLDRLIEAGGNPRRILDAFVRLDLDNLIDIDAVIRETVACWKELDAQQNGLRVAQWLMSGYRDEMLFYMYNHPAKPVLLHLANQVLDVLGHPPLALSDLRGVDCGQGAMIPLHPRLAERLGLGFGRRGARYNTTMGLLGFEEFVIRYIALRRAESNRTAANDA